MAPSRPLRVLVLNWRDIRSPEAGGAEIHLHEVFRRLAARGHDVTLVASQFASGRGKAEEEVDGIRTFRVGRWWHAHLSIPRAARRLIERERFDVLVDDVNKIPFFAPRWSKIPVVALFHHLFGRTVFRETNPLFASAVAWYERRIGPAYRETPGIVVSKSTLDELVRAGVRRERLTVVENGLDHSLYHPGTVSKDPDPLLLVLGRLKAYKRIDVAIRALLLVRERLPGARMVVIGQGGEEARLRRLAHRLSQPVEFLGRISEGDKIAWLRRAHAVLCPSEKEGFGLVALEALACGTPAIVSDVPGHRDAVPDGVGIRVPYGDARAMGDAFIRLFTDPSLAEDLTRRGLGHARGFSWDRAAERVEDTLASVAQRRGEDGFNIGETLWTEKNVANEAAAT
jgi:glycosyltransferase involved in cell wall biosynthesis